MNAAAVTAPAISATRLVIDAALASVRPSVISTRVDRDSMAVAVTSAMFAWSAVIRSASVITPLSSSSVRADSP